MLGSIMQVVIETAVVIIVAIVVIGVMETIMEWFGGNEDE